MGYLNNQSIVVDAILTKKGRQLLAKGKDQFKITQFALGDDEIDYDLWNPAHPLGSDYYGIIIENLPLVEAVPDETQVMKYKLVTLPKKTTRIPVITVAQSSITLRAPGDIAVVTPNTSNFDKGNAVLGYTLILGNSDAATIRVASGGEVSSTVSPSTPSFIGDSESAQSVALVGKSFEIVAKSQAIADVTTTLTIIGNETGGRATISLTVKRTEVATSGTSITS